MQASPGLIGEQHGGVLAGALHHELVVVLAEGLQLVVAGVPPIGVDVVHVLGADLHGTARDGVEVAQDDVRGESHLQRASAPPSTAINTGWNSRMYDRSTRRSCL